MYNENDDLFHSQIFYGGALDELQVSNIMKFLSDPECVALCSSEELTLLRKVVKNHYVEMAKKIIDIQEKNIRLR